MRRLSMEGLESIEHLSELREAVAEAAVQPLNHHVALSRDAALGLHASPSIFGVQPNRERSRLRLSNLECGNVMG